MGVCIAKPQEELKMDSTGEEDTKNSKPEECVRDENNSVENRKQWNPIFRALFEGVYDEKSPLANLRGLPHVIQMIFKHVENYWKSHIQLGQKGEVRVYEPTEGQFVVKLNDQIKYAKYYGGIESGSDSDTSDSSLRNDGTLRSDGDSKKHRVIFPKPSDININMMPFIMAKSFDETSLPDYLRPYFDQVILEGILESRPEIMDGPDGEMGKVCFLSIHESWVQEDESQRRPGLHTECPGKISINEDRKGQEEEDDKDVRDQDLNDTTEKCSRFSRGKGSSEDFDGIHGWGISIGYLKGGIYLASTVRNSCKLWDCQIIPDESEGRDIIGKFGDIEHLRNYIGAGEVMEENLMYWITDLTPHESLPLETRTYRQWFRLVTSGVSLWFQDHSTKNPLGIVPDPKITKIVKGSKFDEASLVIVSTNNDSSNKDL